MPFHAQGQSNNRSWQTGTVIETQQTKVQEGSTYTTSTDGTAKNKGNGTKYSENQTTTKTDNYETYQLYTISTGQKVYTAREHLLFPWSKPATVNVGESVKYAIEKNKLYIVGDDGKEHKATVTKVSMKAE